LLVHVVRICPILSHNAAAEVVNALFWSDATNLNFDNRLMYNST